jgi:predicted nuclease of predicted toxin-antitoxin system
MRFLANENFPLQSVRILRQADLEVASVTEDSPGIEDAEVLARAADEQRVILTFDRDYGELIYRLRLRCQKVSFICGFVLTRRKNQHQYC